jgi:hypothetical protein
MKHNTFKNSIVSMLSVCILLLLSSQAVYAVKPVKVPLTSTTSTTVIHSVVVDITSNTIVVSGAEFATITEVTLGGLAVTFNSTDDGSTGVIDFTDIDDAVTGVLTAGNYSLVVGDNMFSIYLSSADAAAITSPDPVDYTACPCYADWEQFGTNYTDPYSGNPYLGFEGATAYTSTITTEQTEVKIITDDLEHWTLNTQFDGTAGTCGTPDPTFDFELDVTNQTAYEACASYLQATYL